MKFKIRMTKTKKPFIESSELVEMPAVDHVLALDKSEGLLNPVKWKLPVSKRDYIAIIIGLNYKYEFERVFCKKAEYFYMDGDDEKHLRVGFPVDCFRDGLVIEERYSFREESSFVTKTSYYKIFLMEDGVHGEKISKREVKDKVSCIQDEILSEIQALSEKFGRDVIYHTLKAVIRAEGERLKRNTFLISE